MGPPVGAPDWITRWFQVAAIIAFPFWIAFAGFYEFTPSGMKRESRIHPGDSVAHSTGRNLDFAIIGILAMAVMLLVTNQFALRRDATSRASATNATTRAAALAKIPTNSVAVLPRAMTVATRISSISPMAFPRISSTRCRSPPDWK